MKQTRIFALSMVTALVATASAQSGSYSTTGEGVLRWQNESQRISKVGLALERDGRFRLSIEGARDASFRGRWNSRSGDTVSLTVDEGLGSTNTSGSGQALLDRAGEVRQLSLSGNTSRGAYSIRFQDNDSDWDRQDDRYDDRYEDRDRWGNRRGGDFMRNGSLDVQHRGTGSVKFTGRGEDFRLRSARVILERDGDFRIDFNRSSGNDTVTGKWSNRGRSHIIDLDIAQAFGLPADGNGKVALSRGGVSQITMAGTQARRTRRFTAQFNASESGWGGSYRNVDGRYHDDESWTYNGERYQIRYDLELSSNGAATLRIDADGDVKENDWTTDRHGDIIRLLNRQGDGRLTGRWTRSGDRITLQFGPNTLDGKRVNETLRGTYRGDSINLTEYDRNFFGRSSELTFERA